MSGMRPPTPPLTAGGETVVPVLGEFIVKTPGTCGGEPRIAGTRIKVRHVYTWVEKEGMTPAQVVEAYPQLSRAAVHAALAYYWSHQDEIQRDAAEEDRLVAEMKAKAGPSKLQERLARERGPDDPIPPG
jgi:uncharacterized protein (DUF433 family)